MTAENHFEPDLFEMLRGAMNAIHQGRTLLPVEIAELDKLADRIEQLTRDRKDADEQAWHSAAVATKHLLATESVKSEWISAYAELPPMRWTTPDMN